MHLIPDPQAHILRLPNVDHRVRWQPGERLHHLFEARCDALAHEGRAEKIAVHSDDAVLTYAQLDARANQLARHLIATGLRPGDRVALLFDKTVHSHIAVLAVLKLHAAYVPLDPGFPADRMAFICEDAQARVLLSVSHYRALAAGVAPAMLAIDELDAAIDRMPDTRLTPQELQAAGGIDSALCYVIYTSGSTGRPKGVPIDHNAICNFVRVAVETYGYRDTDRVYQGLTLAFDFAVEETWVPLLVGATLYPNQSGSSLLGHDLWQFLQSRQITALCCVPTLLATIEQDLPDLRLLIVSGEACPRDLVTRWAGPQRRMLNAYGPTETTVTATLAELHPDEPVTIGQPLPTYAIVILDPDTPRGLAAGEIGEIGIAGVGVAVGYLNREDQTAKAFIPDFLGIEHNTSGRLYRTGDLGRIREDGQVEYLGRIDTQVKIRGYRIELAEIESVLMQVPAVRQAIVHTHESAPGVVELVAYYTVRPDHDAPSGEALAEALRLQLPGYMVPVYYEHLAQMPMLASDKADRKSLPPPSRGRLHRADQHTVPPEGALETAIAETLAQMLNLPQVSVEDNFFQDLGTSSLLLAHFSARLRERLGRSDLSMKVIYAHPTVRALATHLAAATPATPRASAAAPPRAPHRATTLVYLGCGAAQVIAVLVYSWLQFDVYLRGFDWMMDIDDSLGAYWRAVVVGGATWGLTVLVPVALKWLLIGRWTAGEFPAWGVRYWCFWVVRQLMRFNPMQVFAGTPLYTLYLKALGARVSLRALVVTPTMPICTDLIEIGEDSVISRHVLLNGYRAEGGRIRTGPVRIGRRCFVGDNTLIDIDTAMADDSQLGHSSSLQEGQRLRAGERAHGSPAQPCETVYQTLPEAPRPSALRMAVFSAAQLAMLLLVYLPLPLWLIHLALNANNEHIDLLDRVTDSLSMAPLIGVAGFAAWLVGQTLLMFTVPKVFVRQLEPDRIYPLYGVHHLVLRGVTVLTNSKFHCALAGDSSFVTGYLKALGYRFLGGVEQTGSNFGMNQTHDVPGMCEFGRGTIVSDGLIINNTDLSSRSFRLRPTTMGAKSFVGNAVLFPAGARVGDNCLLATRVLVPLDGPVRQNVGLLGSPSFEIPRSVQRDMQYQIPRDSALFAERLQQKNRSNLVTVGLFLVMEAGGAAIASFVFYLFYGLGHGSSLALAGGGLASLAVLVVYLVLIDRASSGWKRLEARTCSIYDPAFWDHERFWKLALSGDSAVMLMLRGTPFMGLLWRGLGVRVGRQLLDDGTSITEKTLLTLGDHCTLGELSTLQSHSLEDGVFKSDHIAIGDGLTLGSRGYVHYGVRAGDAVRIAPDSFVMKGEELASGSTWQGNPAQAVAA
ncbi:Pls/PosA family non-ribosomal peptide synthetase [Sphaerotilus sp.]|uniref:Pls/PosA family non-ribosomal peptide synthetase n=1 Tax=Sphaerotilus sp. TaxID=2093942 RepID=UPI0034E2D29A